MSDKSFDRQDQALRLMQALSGVDAELLNRSERKTPAKKKILRFAGRYGALCAACLVCVVVGYVYFLNGGLQSKDAAANEGREMDLTAGAKKGITAEVAQEEETILQGEEDGYLLADAVSTVEWKIPAGESRFAAGSNDIDTVPKDNLNGTAPQAEAEKKENVTVSNVDKQMVSGAAFSFSLQAPAGYTGSSEQELQEDGSGVYTWYQEGVPCYVRVVKLDSATIDQLCESGEVLVRDSGGQWLTKLPAADEAGLRQFALSVGNGIVAEYYGYLTEDEIRVLFE